MSVIVTDAGFAADDWTGGFVALPDMPANSDGPLALDLSGSDDPAALVGRFHGINMIRVDFPSFADGRGFTIASRLRQLGYSGRLRARGHVLADQYAMARRVGFDEVEIEESLARRQPEEQWSFRADWKSFHHQARLRG